LLACVVVPARDEETLIGACLAALAGQDGVASDSYEVIVVLDECADGTAAVVRTASEVHAGLRLRTLAGPGHGAGHARRLGMDLAARMLLDAGHPGGLIVSTDADSTVEPGWLRAQLDVAAGGARAIGGRVEIGAAEAAGLAPGVVELRRSQAEARLLRVRIASPDAEHHQFSGASMALTAATYMAIGGLEPHVALEDEGLERRLIEHGVDIARPLAVRVTTSARLNGRARRGLAHDLALADWLTRRTFDGAGFGLDDMLAAKGSTTISVILPARETATTVAAVASLAVALREAGLVEEVLVVDAGSADGTARIARGTGADVVDENDLLAEFGPARGKGDAMWRGLSATSGDVVAYLDTDTIEPTPGFVLGLLGPILTDPSLQLVKGAFQRPFAVGDGSLLPRGGGRVTELCARPLLNLYSPQLAGFEQPLAGEICARRELLEQLAFPVGYGVEIAMLLDALRIAGLDALAQVRLGSRQNRHQSLHDLGAMAYAVLAAVERRVHGTDAAVAGPYVIPGVGGEVRQVPVDERPPLASLVRQT